MMSLPTISLSQKRVVNLPFEFEKSALSASDYDAYFLNNTNDSGFSFVLKDNKKAEYVLFDKNFKIISKIDMDLKSTVFNENIIDYRGGTANGNTYLYVYDEAEKKGLGRSTTVLQLESIDFNSKTIKHQKIFEIPKAEILLSSFSDNNIFYTITADDKKKEMIIYAVNKSGVVSINNIAINIPSTAGKNRDKISTYFSGLKVFKTGEETNLSAISSRVKLFTQPGKLEFVTNIGAAPAHIVTIAIPSFTVQERFIDYAQFDEGEKKMTVNSFLVRGQLFSLMVDKKTIRVAVHDISTGKLQHQFEINEESPFSIFAKSPVYEVRYGKQRSEDKEIDDIRKLIKWLNGSTEGILINENDKGQLIVTIGNYDLFKTSTPGSSAGGYQYTLSSYDGSGAYVFNPNLNYRPGTLSTITSPGYYASTYFKLLMDSNGSKIEKGKLTESVTDQVKDYLKTVDPKVKATNQFNIGERQFYGYYNKDEKSYIVEEINIVK